MPLGIIFALLLLGLKGNKISVEKFSLALMSAEK
jgi:hypothetical protein